MYTLTSLSRMALVLTATALLANCAAPYKTTKAQGPWQNWETNPATTSSLQGKIWSYRDNAFISPEHLAKEMSAADFVLLGETHDNAAHHNLQAWMVSALAERGRSPAVVWEMFDTDQSAVLAEHLATKPENADALGAAIGWSKTGWPKWSMYQPIADAALSANLGMFAGDPPVTLVRAAGKESYTVLQEGQAQELLLDKPLSAGLKSALQQQIVESHCNLIPAEATGPMYRGQRLRDAFMAMGMIENGKTDGAILIAGTGHARLDRAVPWYLRQHQPEKSISSLMFIGVTNEDDNPGDLVPMDPDGNPTADYAWFTPGVVREDPCIALKARFAK